MSQLASILEKASTKPHYPLVLLQSSAAQSSLPLLQHIISVTHNLQRPSTLLVFCLLYRASNIAFLRSSTDRIKIYDWSDVVHGYDQRLQPIEEMTKILNDFSSKGPVEVIIDSIDTLIADYASTMHSYIELRKLLSILSRNSGPSRLIMHLTDQCTLLPLLMQHSFSPKPFAHFVARPASMISHISTSYLIDPPPSSTPEKFWGIFVPLSERRREINNIVYNTDGGGPNTTEFVVELILRGSSVSRKDRNVNRYLEGWSMERGPCELGQMASYTSLWSKKPTMPESAPGPTHGVSFNLDLTESQQQSRAQVPLPYAHEGKLPSIQGAILYDPDSADDIDDDDPDEDLNI